MKLSLISAAVLTFTATGAFAHATLEKGETQQGAGYKAVLRIGHGCSGEATLKVRVQIPEGVIAVKPMPKAGWTLETVKGGYEKEYDYFGSKLTEGVKEVVWTGELLDEHYDEFVFSARITDAFAVGSTAYFPTVQECANGAERWIEIPAEGQDAHDLEGPAPGVKIVEPGQDH
jgi:periplasmic copper chaperone A